MINSRQLKKVLAVILSISMAGFLFIGLVGCEKGGIEPFDTTAEQEGVLPGEGEAQEEGEPELEPEVEPVELIVYVREGGTGDGSKENPMGDPKQAVVLAKSNWPNMPSEVYVAKGTYNVDWSAGEQIKMEEGVSLKGGFSDTDWAQRDPSAYITAINDTSTSGGVPDNPQRAVEFGSGITDATVIDGFHIKGGKGTGSSSAIFNDNGASPTISNNALDGGSGDRSVGVYNVNSSPVIYNNTIYGGGNGPTRSYGISVSSGSPKIYNNTIDGGGGSKYGSGIFLYNGGTPWIDNNIIFVSTSGGGYGIYEYDAASDPKEVNNNDIFNCTPALYYDHDTATNCTTIAAVNNLPDANNNVGDDPDFVSPTNWHLKATSPQAVREDGLDGTSLNWDFTTDKDGNDRTGDGTTGWSMGAYEFNQ